MIKYFCKSLCFRHTLMIRCYFLFSFFNKLTILIRKPRIHIYIIIKFIVTITSRQSSNSINDFNILINFSLIIFNIKIIIFIKNIRYGFNFFISSSVGITLFFRFNSIFLNSIKNQLYILPLSGSLNFKLFFCPILFFIFLTTFK